MDFIAKKINRYKFPPVIILAILALSLYFHFSNGKDSDRVWFAIGFAWVLVMVIYFVLIATVFKYIKNDLIAILMSAGISILCVSRIFAISHWPGAKALTIVSVSMLLIALLLFIPLKLKRREA